MTPVGKALNIVVVGLGQAGCNLAAELARMGYRALLLNTAASDLSALGDLHKSVPKDHRLNIGRNGHDGAGADPAYGRACIEHHANRLRERVGKLADGADLVLFAAGFGGGTGSALPALIDALEPLPLGRAVLATLPSRHESGITKVNALRAVDQLLKIPLDARILVDNARLSLTHGDTPLDRYYEAVNRQICQPLDAFNALNDRESYTPIRVLDGEDLRTLMLSGGFTNLATAPLPGLQVDALLSTVRNAVEQGALLLQGHALDQVSYLGLVIEAPVEVISKVPFADYEHICEQLKHETQGAAVHLALYGGPENSDTVVRILCASHCPPEGIRSMVEQAKQEATLLHEKLKTTPLGLDLGELDELELFHRGTRRPLRPHLPPSDEEAGRRPKRDSIIRTRNPAGAHHGAHHGVEEPAAPLDRDAYDQLVKAYEGSEDRNVKLQVAARLHADSSSPDSLTRYYAVRAMGKLASDDFSAALQVATRDEDATVRAVASKALGR